MKASTTSTKVTSQQESDEADCTGCKCSAIDVIALRRKTLRAVRLMLELGAETSAEEADLMVGD